MGCGFIRVHQCSSVVQFWIGASEERKMATDAHTWARNDKHRWGGTLYMDEVQINSITEIVIGCAFTVSNSLGSGFLEKVDENAMVKALRRIEAIHQAQLVKNEIPELQSVNIE